MNKYSNVINLTQHLATPSQIEAGVIDVPEDLVGELKQQLTFIGEYTANDIAIRVLGLLGWFKLNFPNDHVVMGGSMPPSAQGIFEYLFAKEGFTVLYAISDRNVVDVPKGDGTVEKKVVFSHAGWVKSGLMEVINGSPS